MTTGTHDKAAEREGQNNNNKKTTQKMPSYK